MMQFTHSTSNKANHFEGTGLSQQHLFFFQKKKSLYLHARSPFISFFNCIIWPTGSIALDSREAESSWWLPTGTLCYSNRKQTNQHWTGINPEFIRKPTSSPLQTTATNYGWILRTRSKLFQVCWGICSVHRGARTHARTHARTYMHSTVHCEPRRKAI